MRKFAVILYPHFSLQEITCLTSVLTVWFGEKIDFIASRDGEYLRVTGSAHKNDCAGKDHEL